MFLDKFFGVAFFRNDYTCSHRLIVSWQFYQFRILQQKHCLVLGPVMKIKITIYVSSWYELNKYVDVESSYFTFRYMRELAATRSLIPTICDPKKNWWWVRLYKAAINTTPVAYMQAAKVDILSSLYVKYPINWPINQGCNSLLTQNISVIILMNIKYFENIVVMEIIHYNYQPDHTFLKKTNQSKRNQRNTKRAD